MDPEEAQLPLPIPFSEEDIDNIIEENILKKLSKKIPIETPSISKKASQDITYIENLLNDLLKNNPILSPKNTSSIVKGKTSKTKALPLIIETYPTCKFYSYSKDTSSEYQYANEVNYHTCSHPSCGMMCTYFDCNTVCPFYAEDSSEYLNLKYTSNNTEYNFRVMTKRMNNNSKNFTILDSNNNTLFELNYTPESLQDVDKENINQEISNIISSYLQDLQSNECSLSSIKSPEVKQSTSTNDSPNNYFKSLLSA